MKVLIATSTTDFDPTEVAVPWRYLRNSGIEVCFATDTGLAGYADKRMLDGNKLWPLKRLLTAGRTAREAYAELRLDQAFKRPISFDEINVADFDGLLLPGGHAKGVIPYLESQDLQRAIVCFFKQNIPVSAICHGVIAASRAIDPATGKSVLYGRKTTALLKTQELLAYNLTRYRLGKYYLTYPKTVEDEVTAALRSPEDFQRGPLPLFRDTADDHTRGFTIRDGNYLSARWPGDINRFSTDFINMLKAPS